MRRSGRYSTERARSLGIEALSTLREVVLSPFDIAPVLPSVKHGDDLVVLVHGFFASAGVFRPMRQHLQAQTGASVATFTHVPGVGVKRIALSLARIVDRIPKGVNIHLVGHSLGGLVARWYVQELGGHARVTQTISLAAPFGGAPAAHALPWLVGADLRPSSSVLERLRTGATPDVRHTSIMGTDDRVVFPIDSASFHHGERFVLHGRGHNSLLFDPEVHRIISGCIARPADSSTRVEAELGRTG